MDPIPHVATRSIRRCRLRERLLVLAVSLGESYPGQLASMTGTHPTRVRWALFGHPPQYSVGLSLVGSGLLMVGPDGRHLVPTSRGRRKARSLTASARRRAQRKSPNPSPGIPRR